jgi:hypothetical protein
MSTPANETFLTVASSPTAPRRSPRRKAPSSLRYQRARSRALNELRRRHPDEFRALFVQFRDEENASSDE